MSTNQPNLYWSGDDWYNYLMQQNHPTLANIVKNVADYGDNGTQTPSAYPNTQGQNAIQAQNVPPAGALVMAAQQQSSGLPQPPASNQASNNPLQALISSLNNNGQGTVLNASQQPMGTQQQQAPVSQDQYGQYLTQAQTQQQFPQTGLVPKGLQNQQQQMQQKANPQGQQNPYTTLVNQQLSQLQGDIYNERNTPYTTTNPDGTVSISYGDSSKLKDLNSQYHDLLTGQQDLWNKQQAGVASGKLEQTTEQAKLQEDLQKAQLQYGTSLEDIGDGRKYDPKQGMVFDSQGNVMQLPATVLANMAKGQQAVSKFSDASIKTLAAPANALDALDNYANVLNASKNILNNVKPGDVDPTGQLTVSARARMAQSGISGDPDMTKLINTAQVAATQLAPLLTSRQSLGMLKYINEIVGHPGNYPLSTLQNDIQNLRTMAQENYKNEINAYKNGKYDTSAFEQDYNQRFGNSPIGQTQTMNSTGNQTNNTQNNTQSQEGQTGTWRGQKVIMRNGQWQLQ